MRHIELRFPKNYWQQQRNSLFSVFPQDAYVKINNNKIKLLIEDEAQSKLKSN